jgi:hypothetical protein
LRIEAESNEPQVLPGDSSRGPTNDEGVLGPLDYGYYLVTQSDFDEVERAESHGEWLRLRE